MVMTRLQGARAAIEIGEKKEAEGDIRRAHTAYETAITDFMHLSFTECATVDELKSWISEQPIEIAIGRFIAITEDILTAPPSEWGRYFQSGNYLLIAFSHFFAALGQYERARFFAQISAEPVLFSTTFWGEFSKMHAALVAGRTYTPQFGKLNFLEKYELPYVDLMSAVMHGEPLEARLAEINRQFIVRNMDGRMNDADAYMIEGSPEYPVKFDFRKAGLLAIIDNTKLRALT